MSGKALIANRININIVIPKIKGFIDVNISKSF